MRRTRSVRVPVPAQAAAARAGGAAADPDVATRLTELQQTGGNQMVVRLLAAARSAPATEGPDLAGRLRAQLGRGEPLAGDLRAQAQAGLGQPLGDVRLHRDTEAASLAAGLGARAFTAGQDVFFGDGEYDPASPSGFGVLAHELAHTVQQEAGPVAGQPHGSGLVVSEPGDRDELAASAAARGASLAVGRSGAALAHGGPERAGGLAIQRDTATALPLSDVARSRSEQIRAGASVRLLKVAAYNAAADRAIATYRDRQLDFAQRWGAAWDRHNTVLVRGGEQAATENFIEGLVVGVVASALVAAAGAALFPAAAAAEAWSGTWFAFNAGASVASGAAGSFGADAIARPSVPGPTSGRRDAEADAWREIAAVERAARLVAAVAPRFGLEVGNAEYCIAQVRAHTEHGPTDMSWDDTLSMVSTLANWESGMAGFDAEIDAKLAAINQFGQAAAAFQVPDVTALEKEIWYAWISQLTDDEVLDQDEIQHHLVRLGIIPDYFYMTDEDQHRAVQEAKAHMAAAARPGPPPADQ
jgi:Domain of unknown function (DUF4157)